MNAKPILLILLAGLFLAGDATARVFVATNSTWRYFKGTSEASTPTNDWRELGFDDSAWLTGAAPFHYGTNAVGGDDNFTWGTILTDMRSNYTCVFLRQTFVIDDTNSVRGLWLNVWLDDGFGIWLNGQQAFSLISLGGLAYTNTATSSREGTTRTRVDISAAIASLRSGTNVLCLQAFNRSLTDDDFRIEAELTETPSSRAFDSATATMQENDGQVLLRVVRTGGLDAGVTVDYATTNGTALAGQDYTATNGTLTFAQGETEQTIVVMILNDALTESTESIQVKLSNPGGGATLGATITVTVQINDNDSGFQVEFPNYWVNENAGPVVIAVLRGTDGSLPVTVDYSTFSGTATPGSDFATTIGTLNFGAGEQFKLVSIPILNDGVRENRETFNLSLRNPGAGTALSTGITATVTIIDTDPGVSFERTQHWVHENEGELRVTVQRGHDVQVGPFTVDFATANLTAIAGQDYVATNGTLSFASNEMSRSFAVRILNDETLEADEQFRILLSNVAGDAMLSYPSNATATMTICDATGLKPHRFRSLQVSNDGTVRLTFDGGFSDRFKPFFDIFPLEVSTNLVDWAPLALLVRTNSLTNELTFMDAQAKQMPQRFYRTPATNLNTPQLAPTGPYRVGRIDRVVTDSSRRNRYGISTNCAFPVSIWYPAVAEAGRALALFDEPASARDPDYWTAPWMDRFPYFVAYSQKNARFATDRTNCPVVLQSVGATGSCRDMHMLGEELASHGYVVVAPEPMDSFGVVYPDGSYVKSPVVAGIEEARRDRTVDFGVILGVLEQWNRDDPFLAGHLDMQAIAAEGFSRGGEVVPRFCQVDDRCKVVIILDGGDHAEFAATGLFKPMLTIWSGSSSGSNVLFDKATNNAAWFQISNSLHGDLIAAAFYPDAPRTLAGTEVTRTVNAYSLSFLNKYLKGQDDHLLDGPPSPYAFPRVINFRRK